MNSHMSKVLVKTINTTEEKAKELMKLYNDPNVYPDCIAYLSESGNVYTVKVYELFEPDETEVLT